MNTQYSIFVPLFIYSFIFGMDMPQQEQNKIIVDKIFTFNNVSHTFKHVDREMDSFFNYHIKSIQLSDDGRRISVSLLEPFNTCKRSLQIFDISTDSRIFDTPIVNVGPYDRTTEFFSHDGTHVITSNFDQTHLYDVASRKKILHLRHHDGNNVSCLNHTKTLLAIAFKSLSIAPKNFILTSYDKDNNEHTTTLKSDISYDSLNLIDIKNHTMQSIKLDTIRSLCFDPSDTLLAVASYNKATVYKANNLQCILDIPYQPAVTSVSFNHDGAFLAVASSSDGVKIFNLAGEQIVHIPYKQIGFCDKYLSVSFVNGNSLVAIESTYDVQVFNLEGTCIFSLLKDGNVSINKETLVAFSKNSPRIALAGNNLLKIITCVYNKKTLAS